MKENKLVSIVIPCYNEEKNIDRYPSVLLPELDKLPYVYEVIAVDDGSHKDDTWGALKKIAEKYEKFIALKHSRNYGMGAAYQTGFDRAKGDYIVIFSSDLEIHPKSIAKVVEELDKGNDFVNTYRSGRWQETGLSAMSRRIPSNAANALISKISGVYMKDTGSGLKGFKRFIIDNLKIYGEMHRFLPAYAGLYTKKMTEFEVEYLEREYGTSAYGSLNRTFKVFLDLFALKFMLSFATKPFHMMPGRIFGSTGIVLVSLGSVFGMYLLFLKIFLGQSIGSRPMLMGAILLFISGIQLIMTGLLGELLMRIYFESSGRKVYIVSDEQD